MFEKVNPSHPDKIADRIAGAIVDMAYKETDTPHIAVEVLLGHNQGLIIIEQDVWTGNNDWQFLQAVRDKAVDISGENVYKDISIKMVKQDKNLHDAQSYTVVCGDNGIFKGCLMSDEEKDLTSLVAEMYSLQPKDGKYIICEDANGLPDMYICQSNMNEKLAEVSLQGSLKEVEWGTCIHQMYINPLGQWTGGLTVDSGATNRKLGSDMGRAVTGGGLHGKDLSKSDVTLNILCHIFSQRYQCDVETACKIGDSTVSFKIYMDKEKPKIETLSYKECVHKAKEYVDRIGGFEALAEWGLIRPCKQ